MSPFTPFEGPYSNHCDITLNPGTGVAEITVTFRENNQGPYRCQLWELAPPYTGQPQIKRDWAQGAGYGVNGPFGYGASLVLPNGSLLVAVAAGVDNANSVTPTWHIEPNYAKAYALNAGGMDPVLVARVEALERLTDQQAHTIAAIETALADLSTEGLSPDQLDLLAWVRSLRAAIGILRNMIGMA